MPNYHRLPVKKIVRETNEAVTVLFDIPEQLTEEFRFKPGQFITIQKEIKGAILRRAYSICSSPESGELKIMVKVIENGRFSTFVNRELKEGDILEASAPKGKFILRTNPINKNNYLAFVAGSGITPVFSMIESVLETEKNSRFILVYGNKSAEQTIFKNKLDEFLKRYPDKLEVNYVFSQTPENYALSGRINEKIVENIIQNKYKERSFDQVFICGPEPMTDTVRESLTELGIAKENILFELFSRDLSDKKKKKTNNLSGTSMITFILDEEEDTFEMKKEDFILNVALDNNLDAPYSCQGGICSSCLAKVVEGNAVMEKNTILDEDEIEEGLILTCQAHPTSSKIIIDYDNV